MLEFTIRLVARAVSMHLADPPHVYQPHRVDLMLEYSTGELLARAASMHCADHGIAH